MHDDYRPMQPQPTEAVEPCPCCGADAEVWEYSEGPTALVSRVTMCSNQESIGPRDSLVYSGCVLSMPPQDFYRGTGRDAVRFWNEYAKALTAQQRARRWARANVLRTAPTSAEGANAGVASDE